MPEQTRPNDEGPAFPAGYHPEGNSADQFGMSLRDYHAAHASKVDVENWQCDLAKAGKPCSREDAKYAYPALRSHIAELEAKAAGFDLIRDMFHRFDTRFAGARDQVLLTDDLLERTREAIESAVKKETE